MVKSKDSSIGLLAVLMGSLLFLAAYTPAVAQVGTPGEAPRVNDPNFTGGPSAATGWRSPVTGAASIGDFSWTPDSSVGILLQGIRDRAMQLQNTSTRGNPAPQSALDGRSSADMQRVLEEAQARVNQLRQGGVIPVGGTGVSSNSDSFASPTVPGGVGVASSADLNQIRALLEVVLKRIEELLATAN